MSDETYKMSRCFIYTLNNPTEDEKTRVKAIDCKYHVYGEEIGESGTPHLQGYLIMNKAVRFAAIRKLMPRAYVAARQGTHEQARDYCKKSATVIFEQGVEPLSKRKIGEMEQARYALAYDAAVRGDFDAIPKDIKYRHPSTHLKVYRDNLPTPTILDQLDNHWWWGPRGSGKTSTAYREYPGLFKKNPSNKWWGRYMGQPVVLIDDYAPSFGMFDLIKTWTDHYPFDAETKGGEMLIRPKTIIITANYSLEDCCTVSQQLEPMLRRFKQRQFHLSQ